MRCAAPSLVLIAAVGCAAPNAPLTAVIPSDPIEPRAVAERPIALPDRDALIGTWFESLEGHQCRDTAVVKVQNGELDVAETTCVGDNVYETQSVEYTGHALDISFKEASSGVIFRYHLKQTSRWELDGEVEIGGPDRERRAVHAVTWTKPR